MKTIKSNERTTSMGTTHYTAVLCDGKWVRISAHPDMRYLGRDHDDYYNYEIDVADDAIIARFSRSNRDNEYVIASNEYVIASNGLEWRSFEEADYWAAGADRSGGPITCPHCGREM